MTKSLPWYAIDINTVFDQVASKPEGLTQEEARHRLATYGPNCLRPPEKRSPWIVFLAQFNNILIYVLLAAALVTVLIGHWVDAGVIFGVVFLNALIGFVQEGKAERALDAIRNLLSPQATVLRDGQRISLPADQLVPGDAVFLQSGDKVPADLRLFKVKNLRIDEASLTGESVPVDKSIAPVYEAATIGDRACMAFSGTMVTYGQGSGVVVATGDATELGRISTMLAQAQTLTTRLLVKVAEFGRWLTFAIIGLATATFAFGILVRNYRIADMFMAAVGLAVAAIPEGLPAILTITLAIGVQRMAGRHAIIRRLPSVETLGSVTVICSDKTGTLTRNEMTVKTVGTVNSLFEVSGVGYEPYGSFSLNGTEITSLDSYPELRKLARAAMLCNDAALHQIKGQWHLQGDPTEGALIVMGIKAGLDPAVQQAQYRRIDTIPFESENRFMATLHHDQAGYSFIYLKGAPERLLDVCSYQRVSSKDEALNVGLWQNRIAQIASRGQRPLAVAYQQTNEAKDQLRFEDVQGGLSLLGVVGIIDPPRGDAISAILQCQAAGMRVKMITGDHALTARVIGAQMGIGDGTTAVTGHELAAMGYEQLQKIVRDVDVFARVSPEHKLRLVEALQANGEVIAMTGDGVNDAPALKRADIGVAMGIKGTEVAKEAAEMVLTDDNFASIAHAVEEGRTVYDNIKKAITFILPTNAGEAGTIIAAIALGRVLPITPVQILWVNMITAVTLALSLAFEPPEARMMQRAPRDPREPFLSSLLIRRIVLVSAILVAGTFGLFAWERLNGASVEIARTVAVNTLVMFEVFYLLNTRYLTDPVLSSEGILGNSYVLVAIGMVTLFQLLFTYTLPMQNLFATTGIDFLSWVCIIMVAASLFFLVEMEKYLLRKYTLPRPELGPSVVRGTP